MHADYSTLIEEKELNHKTSKFIVGDRVKRTGQEKYFY